MQSVKDILDLKPRYIIYQLIKKYPGLHQKAIIKKSKFSEGTVRYHLNYLEKNDLISINFNKKYKRFYVKDQISTREKELMSILRKKIPQQIVVHIMLYVAGSRIKISQSLEIHPKLVEYHLKSLIQNGILRKIETKNGIIKVKTRYKIILKEFELSNNEILYTLSDFYEFYDFFIKYSNNFIDKKIIKDCLNWIDFVSRMDLPKIRSSTKSQEDKLTDIIYNVFPHPYHV